MREPPSDLSTETLHASLHAHYGLAATDLTFLALGADAWASVYRVQAADSALYFLKVRKHMTKEAGLLVPRFLQDRGVAQVVAPLPTATGTLWTEAQDYVLTLYPFVTGETGKAQGMTPRQWIEYGEILRRIHDTPVIGDLAHIMPLESFAPADAGLVRELDAVIGTRLFRDPDAQALATFWQEWREEIRTVLTQAEDLGKQLAAKAPSCKRSRPTPRDPYPATRSEVQASGLARLLASRRGRGQPSAA